MRCPGGILPTFHPPPGRRLAAWCLRQRGLAHGTQGRQRRHVRLVEQGGAQQQVAADGHQLRFRWRFVDRRVFNPPIEANEGLQDD